MTENLELMATDRLDEEKRNKLLLFFAEKDDKERPGGAGRFLLHRNAMRHLKSTQTGPCKQKKREFTCYRVIYSLTKTLPRSRTSEDRGGPSAPARRPMRASRTADSRRNLRSFSTGPWPRGEVIMLILSSGPNRKKHTRSVGPFQ